MSRFDSDARADRYEERIRAHAKWKAYRDRMDARHVALQLVRLRLGDGYDPIARYLLRFL